MNSHWTHLHQYLPGLILNPPLPAQDKVTSSSKIDAAPLNADITSMNLKAEDMEIISVTTSFLIFVFLFYLILSILNSNLLSSSIITLTASFTAISNRASSIQEWSKFEWRSSAAIIFIKILYPIGCVFQNQIRQFLIGKRTQSTIRSKQLN